MLSAKGSLAAAFALAAFLSAGSAVRAAELPDLQALLAQMRQMEARLAEQEKTIAALRSAVQGKATANEKVEQALGRSASDRIFHDAELHPRAIKMGGYVDVSYQYSLNRPWNATNHLRSFDNEQSNGFEVHLAELDFDATPQKPGEVGFRFDLAFGNDARKFAGGTVPGITDELFDLQQAWVEYYAPVGRGLHIRLGKCVTPFGYEVIESQDNYNATRSFNFQLGVPFTHTGLHLEYQPSDNWTVKAMLVNGWDLDQDNNAGKTAILQNTWAPTTWRTWTVTGAAGYEKGFKSETVPGGVIYHGDRSDMRYAVNTTLTFTPWENWTFGLEGLWAKEQGHQLTHRDRGDAEWYGGVGYVKWAFLKDFYLASRTEYLADRAGVRTAGLTTPLGHFHNFSRGQKLWSQTVTLSWSPAKPLEMRFEYRHDGSSESPFSGREVKAGDVTGASGNLDSGSRSTQDTLMVQWLYKF